MQLFFSYAHTQTAGENTLHEMESCLTGNQKPFKQMYRLDSEKNVLDYNMNWLGISSPSGLQCKIDFSTT